jgi:aminopeptidase N
MCIPAALILKSTSTPANQTAVGVGELVKRWTHHGRNCFAYKTSSPIPFRFALSSAQYAIKKEQYKGKLFEIYYHPSHDENVDHLLKNTRLTMDYCEKNYGPYPFRTIRFAEISSFTKGFAATAYPATVS